MDEFLKELQELLARHKASLDACECCGGIAVRVKDADDDFYLVISGETLKASR